MTDPEISVSITDERFSIGEIQEFLDTARSIDGMRANAIVEVTVDTGVFTLKTSTEWSNKA